jgi:hypothetical protein
VNICSPVDTCSLANICSRVIVSTTNDQGSLQELPDMAPLPSVTGELQPTLRAAMSHQKKQRENTLFRRILSSASTTDKTAHGRLRSRVLISFLVVLLFSTSLFDAVAAQPHGTRLLPMSVEAVEPDLAWIPSPLLIDTRPPPQVALFMPPLSEDQDATKTLSAPPSKRSLAVDSKNSSPSFTVPRPFDTGLSNNFTSTCATFLNRMLKDDAFNKCHPFSLMLQVRPLSASSVCTVLTPSRRRAASSTYPNHISASHRLSTQLVVLIRPNAPTHWIILPAK